MNRSADLVVLGGGIAGLTIALAAAARGRHVTIIDEQRPGAASRAAAGMLAPTLEGLPPQALHAALAARDLYPAFLARLRHATGLDVALNRAGILEVARDGGELARLHASGPATSTLLHAEALATLEPAFAGHAGALLHHHDGAVDNVGLMTALDRAQQLEPRIRRITSRVTALELSGRSAALVAGDGTRYAGTQLVLAGGAWVGGLHGLPRALPIRPVPGQLLRLGVCPVRHVAYVGGGYMVPRGPTVLIGATVEEPTFESVTTPAGLAALRAIAARAIPSLTHAALVEHWTGLRPMTPDTLPVLGPDPDHPTLVYACGFSRNGILFAPWAAERIVDALTGAAESAELAPFGIGRFDGNGHGLSDITVKHS